MATIKQSRKLGIKTVDLTTFSKDDVQVLRDMVHAYRSRKLNMDSIARIPKMTAYANHSPDHYIARVVEDANQDEIPGLSEESTGTGTAIINVPGYAYCWIYRILHDTDTPMVVKAFETPHLVYNITKSSINPNRFFNTFRDKFGRWIAVVGGNTSMWVRVTARMSVGGIGYYDWEEVDTINGFTTKLDGETGEYALFTAAIEVNRGNRAIEMRQAIVEIHPLDTPDTPDTGSGTGSGPDGGASHFFDDSIPPVPANIITL